MGQSRRLAPPTVGVCSLVHYLRGADEMCVSRQVHIFPEGKIKQDTLDECRRFKWGISRILMESKTAPLVVPIWIRGQPARTPPFDYKC